MRRHAADKNQKPIVRALRKIGAKVVVITGTGEAGAPDLIVGWNGTTYGMETKQKKGVLSDKQIEFHDEWPGGPLEVVRSVSQALDVIGVRLSPAEMDALLAHAYEVKRRAKVSA